MPGTTKNFARVNQAGGSAAADDPYGAFVQKVAADGLGDRVGDILLGQEVCAAFTGGMSPARARSPPNDPRAPHFGFGSMPVKSPADTLAMISEACAQLGERALVCSGWSDFSDLRPSEHVKVVGAMNYAAAFPACRAVVHHGGAGTTAVSLRAGIPTLILSMDVNQTLWGAVLKRLKVGTARHFSRTTRESLVADLRTILTPEYAARSREIAIRMTNPTESVAAAADCLEGFARLRRCG
jgi:UDP:flavonoid glycosyltransferase YjiC (YdhE family)